MDHKIRKHVIYALICLSIMSCKKENPISKEVPFPEPIEEAIIIEVDSTAILDSIARIDSIALAKKLKQQQAQAKKKKTTKKTTAKIVSKDKSAYKSLIFNVQLGINPKRKNWVLFQNGTYVVFPDGYTREQMKNAAIKLIKGFNSNGLSVQKSNFAKGWIVSTPTGIYNYVSSNQVRKGVTDFKLVSARGKKNILKDKSESNVVHINTK